MKAPALDPTRIMASRAQRSWTVEPHSILIRWFKLRHPSTQRLHAQAHAISLIGFRPLELPPNRRKARGCRC
jgi:hypothetical protein